LFRVFFLKQPSQALKEARDIRDDSNNEEESVVDIRFFASAFSVSEVSPTIVTYIELDASNRLNLAS
jgi:hypothetical protein